MAEMSYTSLVASQSTEGSIKRMMNNPTIDVEAVLEDAQKEIYTFLRVREMRSEATLSVSDGSRSVALPTLFLDPISMKDRYFIDVRPTDPDVLKGMWANDSSGNPIESEPNWYSIWDELIYFNVAMDAARSFAFIYYKRPALLSGSNLTNFLTTRYSHVLRCACRKHAAIFLMRDDVEKKEEARLQKLLAAVSVQDDLSYRGFAPQERG